MGIFTRFGDIVNSNINAILDKAEDPEKIVRLMIQEMEDTLVEVRSAAARSIADKKDLNRKIEALDRDLSDWGGKAELALRKGREDLAKAALVEKSRVFATVDVLKQDYLAVDEGLAKLNEDIARLESKLADAKIKLKGMVAGKEPRAVIAPRQDRLSPGERKIRRAMGRFDHLQAQVENLEARVRSYEVGGPLIQVWNTANETAKDPIVEAELKQLKQRISVESRPVEVATAEAEPAASEQPAEEA